MNFILIKRKRYFMKWIFICVLIMQMTDIFSQTRLSGVVHTRVADHVVIQFWKDFSLISDAIPLGKNRQFSKTYFFEDPMYLSIAAEQSTQLLLVMPGENLHVHFKSISRTIERRTDHYQLSFIAVLYVYAS
mgnify:CR=1 FL=1